MGRPPNYYYAVSSLALTAAALHHICQQNGSRKYGNIRNAFRQSSSPFFCDEPTRGSQKKEKKNGSIKTKKGLIESIESIYIYWTIKS